MATDAEIKQEMEANLAALKEQEAPDEDVVEENVENVEVTDEDYSEESEYSEVEQQAISMGWNPEGVEGKRNLSPEEFIDRKKFYDDLRTLKNENKKLREQFDALNEHHRHVKEKERKKLLDELKARKKLAYETEDYDTLVEIDDQIAEASKEPVEETKQDNTVDDQQFQEMFTSWVGRNTWYETDPAMKKEADILAAGFANSSETLPPPEEMFEFVETKMKQLYPEKFGNTRRTRTAPVEKGSKRVAKKAAPKYTAADLPENAKRIMDTLVRTKQITEEQYLKEYFE